MTTELSPWKINSLSLARPWVKTILSGNIQSASFLLFNAIIGINSLQLQYMEDFTYCGKFNGSIACYYNNNGGWGEI